MATSTVYTLQLISLKCLEAMELDGDDIEIRLNGETVWTNNGHKMHPRPHAGGQISEVDFAGGKRHTANGWELMTPYSPGAFVFTNLTGNSRFELWEHDMMNLSRAPVSASDAGHGNISIVFAKDGARYSLTYRITI